jgi:hypothetical protein
LGKCPKSAGSCAFFGGLLEAGGNDLTQFFGGEDDGVAFHAAGVGGFGHQIRDLGVGDAIGAQGRNLQLKATYFSVALVKMRGRR